MSVPSHRLEMCTEPPSIIVATIYSELLNDHDVTSTGLRPWSTSGARSPEHSRGTGRRGGADSDEHLAPVLGSGANTVIDLVRVGAATVA